MNKETEENDKNDLLLMEELMHNQGYIVPIDDLKTVLKKVKED
jgi:hypothetical protein